METLIQLLLLCLGCLIILGLIWDSTRKATSLFAPKRPIEKEGYSRRQAVEKRHTALEITLLLIAKEGVWTEKEILAAFKEVSLYAEAGQTFSRRENIDGTGKIVFYAVPKLAPYFELSTRNDWTTSTITLFFAIQDHQAIATFELLLRTARQLSIRLKGELWDNAQQRLTWLTIDRYRQQIRRASRLIPANAS